jgi:large subunit ribosomal protein L12e
MPPKADPTEIKYILIKVFGGEGGPASTLAPKLGPLGLNAKKIGEDIIKESSKMKGIRQMIQLKVQNRAAEITVVPTTSTLLIKELNVNF